MKKNASEKSVQSKCAACGKDIMLDEIGNGDCDYCGWINQSYFDNLKKYRDTVVCPNLIPLNKARKLYKEGKPFRPSIEDFLGGLFFYTEMEFSYNNKKYGVILIDDGIDMFECGSYESVTFKNKRDFLLHAKVEGKLLKDVWDDVKDPYWLR